MPFLPAPPRDLYFSGHGREIEANAEEWKNRWKEGYLGGESGRVRDGKSGSWPYDHRGEVSTISRAKKKKKCFPSIEGPLEPHPFLLRKREERGLKAGDG